MGKRYCIIRHIGVSNVAPINPVHSLFCHTEGCSESSTYKVIKIMREKVTPAVRRE